jgi:hypothetical protein
VSHLKNILIQTHNACDPSTHCLKFVCEQTLQVLSDEQTVGSMHLSNIDLCVNVIRKTPSVAVEAHVLPLADSALPLKNEREPLIPFSCLEPPPPLMLNPCPSTAPLSNVLHDGALVRIEGLRFKPELNGQYGSICGAFDVPSGRWVVRIDPASAGIVCRDDESRVSVKPENLQTVSLQQPHCPPSDPTLTSTSKDPNADFPPASESKTPNVIATGSSATALLSLMSAIGNVEDDSFVLGANLSHDQQTKMRDAVRALQQGSATGEVDMSIFLSLYENIRKPEDKAIDSVLPISTMVCLHR